MAGEENAAAQAAAQEAPPAAGGASADPEPAPSGGNAASADPEPEPEGDETDWKARSRQWEGRAKANKAKADGKDAEIAERDTRIAELEAKLARTGIVADVAREKCVDAGLLARMAGDTAEEIADNADALLAFVRGQESAFPDVPDAGGAAGTGTVTREDIESIKDPVERVRARRDNIGLFSN